MEGTFSTGGVVSCTFIVKLLLAAPTKFFAEQVTVDCPKGKVAPDAGLQVVVREPLESIADAVKLTMLPLGPVASMTMGVGTVTTGNLVLSTVTVKLALVVPVELVAEQVTVFVPTEKVVPD